MTMMMSGKERFLDELEKIDSHANSLRLSAIDGRIKSSLYCVREKGRVLIGEGKLLMLNKKSTRSRCVLLCNDIFVYARMTSDSARKLDRVVELLLKDIYVGILTGRTKQHSFVIFSPNESFVLVASTVQEKKSWVEKLCFLTNQDAPITDFSDSRLVGYPPLWVEDSNAATCSLCNKNFNIFKRRHHCRDCGLLVCGECSMNSKTLSHGVNSTRHRVCDTCFNDPSSTENLIEDYANDIFVEGNSHVLELENDGDGDEMGLQTGIQQSSGNNTLHQPLMSHSYS
eukprot:m.13731 g.13731  ORF g.13731 m.13731 type:complete len:285 (+) comp4190_c0_seq2:83-937(+)